MVNCDVLVCVTNVLMFESSFSFLFFFFFENPRLREQERERESVVRGITFNALGKNGQERIYESKARFRGSKREEESKVRVLTSRIRELFRVME